MTDEQIRSEGEKIVNWANKFLALFAEAPTYQERRNAIGGLSLALTKACEHVANPGEADMLLSEALRFAKGFLPNLEEHQWPSTT